MTELTEKQSLFLDALFEHKGNVALACKSIDISEAYGYTLFSKLSDEIIKRAESVMALNAPRAAFEYVAAIEGTGTVNERNLRMEAAKQILDRVGLGKKEKVEIDATVKSGIFILPARND